MNTRVALSVSHRPAPLLGRARGGIMAKGEAAGQRTPRPSAKPCIRLMRAVTCAAQSGLACRCAGGYVTA